MFHHGESRLFLPMHSDSADARIDGRRNHPPCSLRATIRPAGGGDESDARSSTGTS